jgi:UDP-glucose 4-epimerase
VNRLAELVGEIVGRQPEKRYAPPRPGDVRDSWADVSAAREVLGYVPSVGFEEGLRRTAEALNV